MAGKVEWTLLGLCRQVDPELFYPAQGGSYAEARKVCDRCEVKATCLEYELAGMIADPEAGTHGMWGGMSPDERHRILRFGARPKVMA